MFYDELFDLPHAAGRFVRTRLMSTQRASLAAKSPAGHVPMWVLTDLFLEEVMGVERPRIEAIRDLGDAVADEIVVNNDRRLFRTAYQATRYPYIRRLLLQASSRRAEDESRSPASTRRPLHGSHLARAWSSSLSRSTVKMSGVNRPAA